MRARFVACALALGLGANASALEANGRFPRAQRLRELGGDPATLVLAATYGLLVTNDRGDTWHHVCETGYAFAIDEIDPLIELVADGALLVTAAHSLNRAPAPFCAFSPVLGGPGDETVLDYAVDPTDRDRIVAVHMRSDGARIEHALFESLDAGRTFTRFGGRLPAEVAFAVTLDLSRSDPSRLILTALGDAGNSLLVRSDDGGATFTALPLAAGIDEVPYLAAVHPTRRDVLYVRTDRWAFDADGAGRAGDRLLVSEDGGASFREILAGGAKLFGFALSPDGSELVAGYGDPVEPSRVVEPSALGIYRAFAVDHAFTKIFDGSVSCLEWTATALYVCTSADERGYSLGSSADARFTLADVSPLTPLLELANVKGPVACPGGTSGAECVERWPDNCSLFERCDGGATSMPPVPTRRAAADSSCGCRAPGDRRSHGALAAGLVAVLACSRRFTKGANRQGSATHPAPGGAGDTRRRDRARDPS